MIESLAKKNNFTISVTKLPFWSFQDWINLQCFIGERLYV